MNAPTSSILNASGLPAKADARATTTAADPGFHYPAPWDAMRGRGFIFPVFANREYNRKHGFLSEADHAGYRGGLGTWMLVDYSSSDVGPYFELLYMPGDFEYRGKRYKRVTKIYVSSELSVREGIRNWAVPKELAEFDWQSDGQRTNVQVRLPGADQAFFAIQLRRKFISFPLLSQLVPFVMLQPGPDSMIRTPLQGRGWGRIARIESLRVDERHFPHPLKAGGWSTGVGVAPFRLDFPVPKHFPRED